MSLTVVVAPPTPVSLYPDGWMVTAPDPDATWHAAHLAGICEERGRILDLIAHHAAKEYQGGWIRRLTEAIREGATAPREDPDQP